MQDFEPPVAKNRNHLQILLSLFGGWVFSLETERISIQISRIRNNMVFPVTILVERVLSGQTRCKNKR